MDKIEEVVAITDPGEVGRAEHNPGDRFTVRVANVFSWIYPILILAIVAQIFLRGSGHNQAWLDDLQWWLYGMAIMIGVGYAVTTNSHVRVDIFYDNFPEDRKTRIEIFGLVWLFLPFIILCWDVTVHYALSSLSAREGSDSPNGLHKLYLLKLFMNASFVFIGIAIWAAYVRFLARLTRPVLWKQLLFAFPSTMFLVNLAVYYGLYWWTFLTGPEDLKPRRIVREPVFDHTITITFALTVILIGVAWLFSRRSPKGA